MRKSRRVSLKKRRRNCMRRRQEKRTEGGTCEGER